MHSPNTNLYKSNNQLHILAICSHHQAEYRTLSGGGGDPLKNSKIRILKKTVSLPSSGIFKHNGDILSENSAFHAMDSWI